MLKNLVITFGAQTIRPLVGLYKKRANQLVDGCLKARDLPTSLKNGEPSRNYTELRKGKGSEQTEIDRSELGEAFDLEELESDFASPVERFKAALGRQVRPKSESWHLRNFEFVFEGRTHKIDDFVQMAEDSQGHFVLYFDRSPTAVPSLINAIETSKPEWKISPEGIRIRIQMPKTLADDRTAIKKTCKSYLNGCKEELMMVKYKYLRILGKQDGLSLSLKLKLQDQLKMMTDQQVKEAERHLQCKLAELQREMD